MALLVESSRGYGRGVLQGIAAYVRTHGSWSLFHHERALAAGIPAWLHDWKGDGIIARLETPKMVRAICKLKLPVVDVRARYRIAGVPTVNTDDELVVRLALDHLHHRGLERFAFCGFSGANYSRERLRHFRLQLAPLGHVPYVYEGRMTSGRMDTTAVEESGIGGEESLGDWLESLPRPIGILAANDIRAQHVLNACRGRNLLVPEEVAVIGVDNDDVICELCDPPLTSVQADARGVGSQAAAILERMMLGGSAPAEPLRVAPRGVVIRRSTDVVAAADSRIATALRIIRDRACQGLTVQDVLRQLPLSRSTLERRFAAVVGRSPKQEIERLRLERIKNLLAETQYPLRVIAERTGFPFPEYLNTFFKHQTGETPASYRRRLAAGETEVVEN